MSEVRDEHLTDWLEQISRQDREAFAELYEATSPRLYGLALRILKDSALAEDAVQETYLQVWERAGTYSSARGRPLTWLLTLCHRRCVDGVRREEARRRKEVVAPPHIKRSEIENYEVLQAVKQLAPKQREIVGLVYYHGLTAQEASEVLQIPLPTVKTRLRDGLTHLRKEWRQADV